MPELKNKGIAASPGIAVGKIRFLKSSHYEIPAYTVNDSESEIKRFENAKKTADSELAGLYGKALSESGKENAEIFQIHRIMLDDRDFCDEIVKNIEVNKENAEKAIEKAAKNFSDILISTGDEYLKARVTDVNDVSGRLIRILLGKSAGRDDTEGECILYSEELTPSEAMQADKTKTLGFLTAFGSSNSHTAILARTNGIPCIVGCGKLPDEMNGKYIVIDGTSGGFEIDPPKETVEIYKNQMQAERLKKERLSSLKGLPTRTSDGKTVKLYANIGSPADVDSVLENDAEGIGLFRTEFIFMEGTEPPDEDSQFDIYRDVVCRMNGKKTIIRTLDIGADKHADYLKLPEEENPALGLRGTRLCLEAPEIFKVQLRAIMRASVYGKTAIMFPMIASLWEIKEIKKILKEVCDSLEKANIPFDRNIETGIMVETPASAILAGEFASEVDFFSIGTNDLTQYTLAADRQNRAVSRYYRQDHEAVLKLIRNVCKSAHNAGIWVGICGEIASDVSAVRKLVSIGADELSVSPPMVLPIREEIRKI